MFDIIVPTYNQEEHTIRCFRSIRDFTKDYRLIWIDNGSDISSKNKVMEELKNHTNKEVIFLAENLGFVKATNLGIKKALEGGSEYIVLLNNDTEVTPGWAELLRQPFEDIAVGATGPMTNNTNCSQCIEWTNPRVSKPIDSLTGSTLEKSEKLKSFYNGYYLECGLLSFFCTMFKREVFENVGLLDESFGMGLMDDYDYCYKMKLKNYKLVHVLECFVAHNHRTTFKTGFTREQLDEMIKANREHLYKKHCLTEFDLRVKLCRR